MRKFICVLIFLFFLPLFLFGNALKMQTSPYLRQHVTNPVQWYPYTKKIFDMAQNKNKIIFLSIGYATCYWCHKMEEESFKNEDIASLLNKHCISVKVDREEMNDIDTLYQNIYKKLKGDTGGWPLNVFLTPQGEVLYITNYIPAFTKGDIQGFDTLIPYLTKLYHDDEMRSYTIQANKKKLLRVTQQKKHSLEEVVEDLEESFDPFYKGFGESVKFPQIQKLTFMLEFAIQTKNRELKKNVLDSLDMMALRGFYDHVEGGFFRYCVDSAWEIPHFEKMLYTQAQMIAIYAKAYRLTHKKLYKDVVKESIEFLDTYFLEKGVYKSASDAGEVGKEGNYYTYSVDEISTIVNNTQDGKKFAKLIDFQGYGNFENRVHLNIYGTSKPVWFEPFRKKLLALRKQRTFPFIDAKINTAWNGLLVMGLYEASSIDAEYEKKATALLQNLLQKMFIQGELYHQTLLAYKPQQKALLEDYSFIIGALLKSYEKTVHKETLELANYLLLKSKTLFYRDGLWYASSKRDIVANTNDKYYTSGYTQMMQNLQLMSRLEPSFGYDTILKKSLHHFHPLYSLSLYH